MATLDFVNFEKPPSAFDFPRLLVDELGWNHAPAIGVVCSTEPTAP